MGRVLRASGLTGDLRVQLFRARRPTPAGARAVFGASIGLERSGESAVLHFIERVRWVNPTNVVVRLKGVSDRNAAEALAGSFVVIDPRTPPEVLTDDADRVFGARAIEEGTGRVLGTVVAIEDNGAQPLLVIRRDEEESESEGATPGAREKLVPFVGELIGSIEKTDRGETVIRIRTIPGLVDDAEL